MTTPLKILVLCTGNSCRSQMAEGYLRHFAQGNADIYSAGIETHGVNPRAIATMKEDGIDISSHTSNNVSEYLHIQFDHVITVCDHAKESCPVFPAASSFTHHSFPDPAKCIGSETEIAAAFRDTRNLIRNFSEQFIKENVTA